MLGDSQPPVRVKLIQKFVKHVLREGTPFLEKPKSLLMCVFLAMKENTPSQAKNRAAHQFALIVVQACTKTAWVLLHARLVQAADTQYPGRNKLVLVSALDVMLADIQLREMLKQASQFVRHVSRVDTQSPVRGKPEKQFVFLVPVASTLLQVRPRQARVRVNHAALELFRSQGHSRLVLMYVSLVVLVSTQSQVQVKQV